MTAIAVRFSGHALSRVTQRLIISNDNIAILLLMEKCVVIGSMARRHRVYKLFWSRPDRDCFVAVQLDKGRIITIIPSNRFKINESDLICLLRKQKEDFGEAELALLQNPPRSYHFRIIFIDSTTGKSRSKKHKIPTADYPDFIICFRALQYVEKVQNELIEIISRNIRPSERLFRVVIYIDKRNELFWVPWNIYSFRIRDVITDQ